MVMSRQEFFHFVRFCVVGVGNTLVHVGAVLLFVERLHWQPTIGNAGAFLVANLFSYLINSHWTFRTGVSLAVYLRFFAVSLVGLGLSWGAVALAAVLHLHYLVGVFASIAAVALVGYGLNRLFVFRHLKSPG